MKQKHVSIMSLLSSNNFVLQESQRLAWPKHLESLKSLDSTYLDHIIALSNQKTFIHEQWQTQFYQSLFAMPSYTDSELLRVKQRQMDRIKVLETGYCETIYELLQQKIECQINLMQQFYDHIFNDLNAEYSMKKQQNIKHRVVSKTANKKRRREPMTSPTATRHSNILAPFGAVNGIKIIVNPSTEPPRKRVKRINGCKNGTESAQYVLSSHSSSNPLVSMLPDLCTLHNTVNPSISGGSNLPIKIEGAVHSETTESEESQHPEHSNGNIPGEIPPEIPPIDISMEMQHETVESGDLDQNEVLEALRLLPVPPPSLPPPPTPPMKDKEDGIPSLPPPPSLEGIAGKPMMLCGRKGCNFSTNHPASYRRHAKGHFSTSSRHHCMWPGCDKSYGRLDHLRRHERIHKQAFDFKCDWKGCDATFTRRDKLKAHRARHERYKCEWCEFQCMYNKELKHHMDEDHPKHISLLDD